eukprot:10291424-Lingulodinium_polyedra.AAC.1
MKKEATHLANARNFEQGVLRRAVNAQVRALAALQLSNCLLEDHSPAPASPLVRAPGALSERERFMKGDLVVDKESCRVGR